MESLIEMKLNYKVVLMALLGAVLVPSISSAQQLPLSNLHMQNKFSYNPAAAGANGFFEAFLGYRQQWTGIDGAPTTAFFNGNTLLGEKHGLGLSITSDRAHIFERLNFSVGYAYHLKFADEHTLAFGVNAGGVQNRINLADAIVESPDMLLMTGQQSSFAFNADFGVLYRVKGLFASITLPTLLEPTFDYTVDNADNGSLVLRRHFMANVGYNWQVNDDWAVIPNAMIRSLPAVDMQFDVGANVNYKNKFWTGVNYRQDAGIIAGLGFTFADRWNVGYAYEFGGNGIVGQSGGSHEVLLGFQMRNKEEKPEPIVDTPVETPVEEPVVEEPTYTYSTLELDPGGVMEMVIEDGEGNVQRVVKSNADGTVRFEELDLDEDYKITLKDAQDEPVIYVLNDNGERVGKMVRNEDGTYTFRALSREEINALPVLAEDTPIEEPVVEEPVVEEPVVEEPVQETGSEEPEVTAMGNGFYIVVGAYYTTERAQRGVEQVNEKGHDASIATRQGSKWYFVSVKQFDQRQEAIEYMENLRKNGFDRAWVMVGK